MSQSKETHKYQILSQIGQAPTESDFPIVPVLTGPMQTGINKLNESETNPYLRERLAVSNLADEQERMFSLHFNSFKLPENFPHKLWQILENERAATYNESLALIQSMKSVNPEKSETSETAMKAIVKIARNLLIADIMENQVNLATRHGLINHYSPLSQTLKFKTCGENFIRIAGFSMNDFLRSDKEVGLTQFLKSSVEATSARRDYSYTNVLSENIDNPLMQQHPSMAEFIAHNACEQLSVFSVVADDIYSMVKLPYRNELGRKIVTKTKDIVSTAIKIKKDLLSSLFDQNFSEFPDMKRLVTKYLSEEDPLMKSILFVKFGLGDPSTLIRTYRSIRSSFSTGGEHKDFYEKLANSLIEFNRDFFQDPQLINPVSLEDSLKFLPKTNLEKANIPSFEELKKINEQIQKFSPQLIYAVSPDKVNFNGSEVLQNIKLEFIDKVDPTKVNVFILGKHANFVIGLNTKRGMIFWNSLDDPDKPDMRPLREEALLLMKSILNEVYRQAELQYQEKQKNKIEPETIISPIPTKRGEKVRIPREKFVKEKPQEPLTPIKKAQKEEVIASEEKTIKRYIDIPTECPKNFPREKWLMMVARIKEYNLDNRKGNIKHLISVRSKKHFERLEVDEEYRVILTKNNSNGDGTMNFRVVAIVKRNDEYKELKRLSR